MFGIGFGEMLIIAVILLLVVGPKELPALLKTVGKGMREIKKASSELRKSTGIDELLHDDELRTALKVDAQPRYRLRASDRERENPREGVDAAHALAQAEALLRVPQGEVAMLDEEHP
jgi:sec-independent protein translocase protein TatB